MTPPLSCNHSYSFLSLLEKNLNLLPGLTKGCRTLAPGSLSPSLITFQPWPSLFLEYYNFVNVKGPLKYMCLLLIDLPVNFAWKVPSCHSELSLNATSSEHISLKK